MNVFSVYVLIKKSKPIYVGCTMDLKRRIKEHSLNHKFDSYRVVKTYKDREKAFCAENAILRFSNIFDSIDLKNAKDVSITHKNLYYD